MFLEAHFGEVELHMPDPVSQIKGDHPEDNAKEEEPTLLVRLDEADAVINLLSMVSCKSIYSTVSRGEGTIDEFAVRG